VKENKSGRNFLICTGSKSNNFETNASQADFEMINTAFLVPKEEVNATDKDVEEAVVYDGEVTSIDFMLPENERAILEKNLNMYGDVKEMQKVLNIAKNNKLISEDIKTLELVSKTGEFSNKLFDLLMNEENLAVLQEYIRRKFDEGDIAKAYKEVGLLNKAMLDARETMINKLKMTKTGKSAKIALKFTNDNGEDFQLGAEVDV
jgi:hypothetical protein